MGQGLPHELVRILIVSGIWPPDVGGPATHAPEVADFLRARGHDVAVLTTGNLAWAIGLEIAYLLMPVWAVLLALQLGVHRSVAQLAQLQRITHALLSFAPQLNLVPIARERPHGPAGALRVGPQRRVLRLLLQLRQVLLLSR